MEEAETWKDVVGWEEKYKVSNHARVWNKITDVEVAQVLTGDPLYKYVNLNYNKFYKLRRVHVLVAHAFILNDDPENKKFVDHIDRDKMNNHLSNLRWVTRSENQRNMNNSVKVGETLLKDYALKYEKPENAYSYIFRLMNDGIDEFEAVEKYEEYLEQGWNRRKIVWNGVEVYLTELCTTLNKPYDVVSARLSQGWDVWNAVNDIRPSWCYSFEVIDSKGVGHWYRDNEMFETQHPSCLGTWRRLKDEGKTLDEILAYDGKDHLRQTIEGINGTLTELCKHFNKTLSNVQTRVEKGMSLRDALLSPPERVKKVTINGISGSPKYWYGEFGLDYKTVKHKKDKLKCSFEDILKYFGIDLTDKVISYTD
jgi:hypothetical protein